MQHTAMFPFEYIRSRLGLLAQIVRGIDLVDLLKHLPSLSCFPAADVGMSVLQPPL